MALGYVMAFGLSTIVALLLLLRLGKRVLSPAHTVARDLAEDNVAAIFRIVMATPRRRLETGVRTGGPRLPRIDGTFHAGR